MAFGHDIGSPSPEDTVRDFLITAVAEQAGVEACGYLTPHGSSQLAAAEPPDTSCELALDDANLTLGGERIGDEAAVKELSYHERERGDRATVTIEANGATRTFQLRKVSEPAPGPAPDSPWRIDTGAAALVGR